MRPTYQLLLVTRYKRKDGKFPVKVRIGFLRKSKDFKTPLYLTEDEYQQVILPKTSKQYQQLKLRFDTLKAKLIEIMNSIENFSYQVFEDKFYNKTKKASDVYSIFDELISSLSNSGHYTNSTVYNTAKNSFKKFRSKLSFYDVSVDFLNKYHKYMVAEGKSTTTISIYVRCLKAVINYSIEMKYLKKDFDYPFGKRKYQIPAGRNIKKALASETIELLFNYNAIPFTQLDKAKDFFLFSYMCNGMNVNDIINLKWKNIDGKMLRYMRGKTKNTAQSNMMIISISIEEPLQNIIDKWGKPSNDKEDYIFNFINREDNPEIVYKKKGLLTANLNSWLKNICKDLQLTENITMIFARHSAATILKRSGIDRQQISESLGHTNISTTNHYLDSFDDESKMIISKTLLNFQNLS